MRAHSIENFNGKTYARTDYKTIERKHCGKLKEEKTPQDEQAQALQALQGEPSQEAHLGLLRRRFAPPPKGGIASGKVFPTFRAGKKRFQKSFQAVRSANGVFLSAQRRLRPRRRSGFTPHSRINPSLSGGLPRQGDPAEARPAPTKRPTESGTLQQTIFSFTSPRPALKSAQIYPQ